MSIELDRYIDAHSTLASDVLHELERETNLSVLQPRMISGKVQGQLLTMLMRMINPKQVLEIGTFTGYSAISMALGMSDDSCLHTIEINDELEGIAAKYIQKAKLEHRVVQHIGDALAVIPEINEHFDFVFLDGNKRHYCEYYQAVFDKLQVGGFILADNILWDGKVVQEVDRKDAQTQNIIKFNNMISEDERVEQVILPIRDGLMLIYKKKDS